MSLSTSQIVFFRDNNIDEGAWETREWPAQPLDLNFIGNVRRGMKKCVFEKYRLMKTLYAM